MAKKKRRKKKKKTGTMDNDKMIIKLCGRRAFEMLKGCHSSYMESDDKKNYNRGKEKKEWKKEAEL